jgi:ubiquinone/menaquinone biosynthesis C-methylase UbiE
LDISQTFVEIAQKNAALAKVQAEFQRGNVSAMPFGKDQFDYVVCRAAFKNFTTPVAALQEMCRVLKPGGRALIVDLRRDASRDSIRQAVRAMNTGVLNRMMIYLTFRFMLLKRAYTKADFERMIGLTAFRTRELSTNLIGLEVLLEKV